MRDFDYAKTFQLCEVYHSLGVQEHAIVSFLFNTDVFEGSYTDLAKAVGILVTNVRRAAIRLENAGIICIVKKENGNPKAFFLVDGWMDALITSVNGGAVLRNKLYKKL